MFMRPSTALNQLVRYVLAVSVERFGILLHAYCFMSNHLHLVLTDPLGALPAFEQYLGSLLARSCNALVGHRGSFWEPGSYNAVTLVEARDVDDKLVYTLANPVSAGLVRRGAEWPGCRSTPEAIEGPPEIAARPPNFFRREGSLPASAALKLAAPPGIASIEEFRRMLRRRVARREDEAAEQLASRGGSFLGARGVLAQDPFSAPSTEEPPRNVKPRIACQDRQKRAKALARLKAFLRAYREAWDEFASGLRETLFPHGTYWMRVAYAVPCAPAG